ncbi:MAG TPA: hypothetical protein VKX17_02825 [Planctomycetota bacterium]|nr:hypothetical protein [Planctomycetota bacterium]
MRFDFRRVPTTLFAVFFVVVAARLIAGEENRTGTPSRELTKGGGGTASLAGTTWNFVHTDHFGTVENIAIGFNADGSLTNCATNSACVGSWTLSGTDFSMTFGNNQAPQFIDHYTGTLATTTISGSVTNAFTGDDGTFTATLGAATTPAKLFATEKLTEGLDKNKGIAQDYVEIGSYKILASVPIPSGFDFTTLNAQSHFSLAFGSRYIQGMDLGYDKSFVPGTSTKVHYAPLDPFLGFSPAIFDLDWTSKTTLKIAIHGSYFNQLLPNTKGPFGSDIQALDYENASTEKVSVTGQSVSVTFASLSTSFPVVSLVAVKESQKMFDNKSVAISTIGIVSTTLKPTKTPAARAHAAP